MKKIIIIAAAAIVVIAAVLYFFVFSGDKEVPEVFVNFPLEVFTTNIGGGSSGYLKTTLVIVVNSDSPELAAMLTDQTPRIRDTILFILRDLTEEDISAPGTKDDLRARIITQLNAKLGIDNVVEVLFNDFVMA